MAKLEILTYPDKRLRQIAKPVTEFNDRLHALSQDMAETMYDAPGIGLAAVQVNVALRLIVMDLSFISLREILPKIIVLGPEELSYYYYMNI